MFALVLLLFGLVTAIYIFIVRPILKTQPVFSDAFKAEAALTDKIRAKLTGWKTKIMARLLVIGGVFVEVYNELLPFVAGQDWSPLTSQVPAWSVPLGVVVLGWLFERLRQATANPPQIVTQRIDGVAQVVDVKAPAS